MTRAIMTGVAVFAFLFTYLAIGAQHSGESLNAWIIIIIALVSVREMKP